MVWNDLNKQTKQVGLQIGLASCSMHKWMKGNVWRIKNVKRVSVKPEKTSWIFLNISEIFHEIFHEIFQVQGKTFHEILHHYLRGKGMEPGGQRSWSHGAEIGHQNLF